MQLYSFKDMGDLGNYDGCKELSEVASYNVLNMNITKLPVDIRLGLCLPKECTQEMFNKAQDPVSSIISKAAFLMGEILQIGFVVRYHVGFTISWVQTDAWFERQAETKSTGAILVLTFMGIFLIIGIIFSLIEYFRKEKEQNRLKNSYITQNFSRDIERVLDDRETIERGSTRALTMMSRVNPQTTTLSMDQSISNRNLNHTQHTFNSSRVSEIRSKKNLTRNAYQKTHDFRNPSNSLFTDLVSCFSVPKNLFSLNNPRTYNKEDKDLECLEGIRVLTMCWVLITMTCVYILTMNCRNLYLMIDYFNTYAFALIVSGIITPDLFIFLIYFLGFIKMSRYYDQNGGIGPWDYLKLYAHRYFKLAPLYYFVFFFGWLVLPFLNDSSGWFVTERLFMKCEEQWFYVLTFLNNLIPFFTKCLEGCYYWPYVIPNDMLLHTLFPLWIIVFKRNRFVFYALNSVFLVGGFFINGFIAYNNELKVGIFTFEDYHLFSSMFNKPYTKIAALSLGMFMGLFYLRLMEYRKSSDEDKQKKFKLMHFVHGSKIVAVLLYIYSIAMLNFITGVTLTANQNGYSWTTAQNIMFFSFSRFGYMTSVMTTIIILLIGRGNLIKQFLSQPLWRPFSRL